MQHPGGPWLVGFAGVIIVIIGIVLVTEGIRRKFMKCLLTPEMSPRTRGLVRKLGMIGSVARCVVIVLAGILVTDAAVTHSPVAASPSFARHSRTRAVLPRGHLGLPGSG